MKICIKCKNECKDTADFCPKCGTPFKEKITIVKILIGIGEFIVEAIKEIINHILYIIGFTALFAGLTFIIIGEGILISNIIVMLLGISLFENFYILIGNKFLNIRESHLKIARVLIPVILLLIILEIYILL